MFSFVFQIGITVFLIDPRYNLMPKKVIRPQMLWISYLLKWTEYCNADIQYDFIRSIFIYAYSDAKLVDINTFLALF